MHLIFLCAAVLGGFALGVAAHHAYSRQRLEQMRQRVLRAEEARNGAIERSAHAREQIAQLSKAISDLRTAHRTARAEPARDAASAAAPTASASASAEERRALAERALAAAGAQRPEPSGALLFANTQPMEL